MIIVNVSVKYGLRIRSFTHTQIDLLTHPVDASYRRGFLELLRGPGCAVNVEPGSRWCLYTSYLPIPWSHRSGTGHWGL